MDSMNDKVDKMTVEQALKQMLPHTLIIVKEKNIMLHFVMIL